MGRQNIRPDVSTPPGHANGRGSGPHGAPRRDGDRAERLCSGAHECFRNQDAAFAPRALSFRAIFDGSGQRTMKLNSSLLKATGVGALGGLLFGFDTAVISGTTQSLTDVYGFTPTTLGITVSMALCGTVVGAMSAGIPGQKFGGRETLRVLAVFYVLSALGCALAWNWSALLFARFLGGLAIGGSSVLGPVYIS